MAESNEFTGLSMSVFTAFGWAGEEAAIQFALSQLEQFINELHKALPSNLKNLMSHTGLSKENQNVNMSQEPDGKGLALEFNARPMSLEMGIRVSDQAALNTLYKQAVKDAALGHRLITQLGPAWTLHIQQMQYDPETEQASTYQDVFKGSLSEFDDETAVSVFEKGAYLNGEEKWIAPFLLSYRFESEKISAMGSAVINVMKEQLAETAPLLNFLTAQKAKKRTTKKKTRSTRTTAKAKKETAVSSTVTIDDDSFIYIATLKPLHLRRGFVNMTSKHWPFFSLNSRTETRKVTVYYDGIYDKACTVWRMLPNDRARLVLSPPVHDWLSSQFSSEEQIQLTARKLEEKEIQISLKGIAN